MNRNIQVVIWLVWIFVWPISLFLVYINTSPAFHPHILLFALLASLVALFPIVISDRPIFLPMV
ncbi:hypothetical protein [Salimicrobium flavidum]|uniref:hypothetical protein n=1 Tax=Salimicrobium flavidum TaxID=570947 RepID=UPI00097051AF|nr:hypothetical protein [Salimicrobium flavidum]